MLVRDFMTSNPIVIRPHDSLRVALELMVLKRIRHLPVVNPHAEMIGLITDRDVRRLAPSPLAKGHPDSTKVIMDETPVEQVMLRAPVTAAPIEPLKVAAERMLQHRFGALPVVDGTRLVGILSQVDVLRALLAKL